MIFSLLKRRFLALVFDQGLFYVYRVFLVKGKNRSKKTRLLINGFRIGWLFGRKDFFFGKKN